MDFLKNKKLILVYLVIILLGVIFLSKYPFGVKKYKTIQIGMQAFQSGGSKTYWAPPDDIVPESDFYVYSIGDESMCIGASCGMGGYFVECIGGYLSGEKIRTEEFDYGLGGEGVDTKNLKIITVAGKDGKIVGIYPGAKIRNLPYIMRNHSDLIDDDRFKVCSDLLPSRWK